jgi:hypothetical protein
MPQDFNSSEQYSPEVVSRFQQFVVATEQFESNYSSWLTNSTALQGNPGALDSVSRIGAYLLQMSQELMLSYQSGEFADASNLLKLDEVVLSINHLTQYVQGLQNQRNDFIEQENIESQQSLSGVTYVQYLGIQAIHNTFTLIKQGNTISMTPFDTFGIGPEITLEELTEITPESLIQDGLDSSITSPVLNMIGISNLQDFQQLRDQNFDYTKLPAVIGLVSLSIPSEISQIADFVIDFIETTLILGLVQTNRNEVLNSREVAPILEENQVLNLFAIGSRLPEYLSQINLEPELIDEIQAFMQDLFASMSEPSQLSVGELANYISIAIAIIATIMTLGTGLPAKAADLSARAARFAMGATSTHSFNLWSRASRILASISRRTSALSGMPIPPALLALDSALAGTPGIHILSPRLARVPGLLNNGSEVSEPVQDAVQFAEETTTDLSRTETIAPTSVSPQDPQQQDNTEVNFSDPSQHSDPETQQSISKEPDQ